MILLPSKVPLFASAEQRRNGATMYFDEDGQLACVNVAVRGARRARLCVLCGNCCISFIVNDDGTYTCSACGKFPKELIQKGA